MAGLDRGHPPVDNRAVAQESPPEESAPDPSAQVLSFLLLLEAVLITGVSAFLGLLIYGFCGSDEYDCDASSYVLGAVVVVIAVGVGALAARTLLGGCRTPPTLTTPQVWFRFLMGAAAGLCWLAIVTGGRV